MKENWNVNTNWTTRTLGEETVFKSQIVAWKKLLRMQFVCKSVPNSPASNDPILPAAIVQFHATAPSASATS